MGNAWFRFYHEWDSDPKVQMMPEVMQRRLVMLFCWRCKGETFHVTRAAFHWRVTEADLAETKELFMRQGFIDANWDLLNWNRRQFLSDSSTDRVRRHREALKHDETLHETVVPVTVTAPDTDTDTETDTEAKKTKAKAPAKDRPSPFSLPEWINAGTWKDFEEMRQRKRAPLTDRARRGIMAELEKIRNAGGDPEPVLLQSITNAWSGVFPLKTANGGVSGQRYSIWDELKKSIAADQDGAGDDGGVPGS